jgi:hypothetical protein
VSEAALTSAERALLGALNELGVSYLVVGLSAAALQGARVVTQDIDLWFEDRSDPRIAEAVRRAGGIWIPGSFGMMPPMIGGDALGDRFDVVLTMSGLGSFASEVPASRTVSVDGVPLRLLPLDRIIHSKRAAGRPKDLASLPALEAALAVEQDDATTPKR